MVQEAPEGIPVAADTERFVLVDLNDLADTLAIALPPAETHPAEEAQAKSEISGESVQPSKSHQHATCPGKQPVLSGSEVGPTQPSCSQNVMSSCLKGFRVQSLVSRSTRSHEFRCLSEFPTCRPWSSVCRRPKRAHRRVFQTFPNTPSRRWTT